MEDCFDYDHVSELADADELRKLFEYCREFAKPEHNDIEAQFNLACCYFEGIGVDADHREAFKWFKKSAEQGHVQAQSLLAGCYKNGIGVEPDVIKAVELYKMAAEQGDADAQAQLGLIYELGNGVDQDKAKAAKFYEEAAKNNHVEAQFRIGWCYLTGFGVKQDVESAAEWYEKAAENGLARAKYFLGRLYLENSSDDSCKVRAFELFSEADELGDVDGRLYCALAILTGTGTEQDVQTGLEMLRELAEQGHDEAQYYLGGFCITEYHTQESREKAVELLLRSAKQKNENALSLLGECLCKGIGVDKIEKEAVETFLAVGVRKRDPLSIGKLYENAKKLKDYKIKALACYKHAKDLNLDAGSYYKLLSEIQREELNAEMIRAHSREEQIRNESLRQKSSRDPDGKILKMFPGYTLSEVCEFIQPFAQYVKKEMNKNVQELRKRIIGQLDANDEKTAEFLREANNDITHQIQESGLGLINESETALINYFGELLWKKMQKETKTSLVSARTLWQICGEFSDSADFDYSGIVINATSALENELGYWLFDKFKKHVHKIKGDNYGEWPKRLLDQKNKPLNRSGFTLGSIPYLFGQISDSDSPETINDNPKLKESRESHLATILRDITDEDRASRAETFSDLFLKDIRNERRKENKNDPPSEKRVYEIGSLIHKFQKIRKDFRNKAAHTGHIDKKTAEECYAQIVEKYEAENRLQSINTVLKEFLQLLK